jgi:release factor glutamine methyltransferase
MNRYRQVFEEGRRALEESGNAEAQLDARLLLEAVCGTDAAVLYAEEDREVTDAQYRSYRQYIRRRAAHKPVAYILGQAWFMGLPFKVTADVLIPNQDTEFLVEEAMPEVHDGMRILDLCTGSGCILLSLLHYSNRCTGTGTDISEKALAVALENADSLGLSKQAYFCRGDLYGALAPGSPRFDLIVSNPPYIRTGDIAGLAEEVRDAEPGIALDGGDDGLSFYRRILPDAARHLVIGGTLLTETGFDEGPAVARLFEENGFRDVRIRKDYGGLDRVVRGECTGRRDGKLYAGFDV